VFVDPPRSPLYESIGQLKQLPLTQPIHWGSKLDLAIHYRRQNALSKDPLP
jgi:hypothetical protein